MHYTARNNILFVIVLYNQRLESCRSYASLLSLYNDLSIYIYDNSPSAQHSLQEFGNNICYVSRPDNPGLSYAYNRAAEYAEKNGFGWMFLLDQDTGFAPRSLPEYIDAINSNPSVMLFSSPMAIGSGKYISPLRKRAFFIQAITKIPLGIIPSAKYTVINSGMMINVAAFAAVGGYKEQVWLDFSDIQFVDRFSRKYEDIFIVDSPSFQEFSDEVHTASQKIERFRIFCTCLKHCERAGICDDLFYFCVVSKRMLSLIVKTKSFKSVPVFFKYYLGSGTKSQTGRLI